jgi:hypothetical protein
MRYSVIAFYWKFDFSATKAVIPCRPTPAIARGKVEAIYNELLLSHKIVCAILILVRCPYETHKSITPNVFLDR